jgi:hypothetical protein
MTTETATRTYKGFVSLEKPVHIWTLDGGYNAPRLIAKAKTPTGMNMPQTIVFLKGQRPRQRMLTSGEWHQVRGMLEATNPDVEDNMTTGYYERSSTLVDYDHGCVIQIPELDAEGNLVMDGQHIKGRHVWEMALPKKSDDVKNMSADLAKFFNTIYGMEDAAKQLPDDAHFFIDENPSGVRNLLCGYYRYNYRETRRFDIHGCWWPSHWRWNVASRGAVDNARLVNRLNDAEYAAQIEGLVEKAKHASHEQAAEILGQIKLLAEGALVWEDM